VFQILEEVKPRNAAGEPVSSENGRPGMEQWKILVLGVLRLGLNTDYDRLHELANPHKTVRQFLGHVEWCDDYQYNPQTLRDNLRLFTPEILDRINRAVVEAGHVLVKKKPSGGPIDLDPLQARCDSFVVETHVHYPTDINLLWDAVRKTLREAHDLAEGFNIPGWRQSRHHIKVFKRHYRRVQKARRQKKAREVLEAEYLTYLTRALDHLERSEQLVQQLRDHKATAALEGYQGYVRLLVDPIHRRCLEGEPIPHEEKIFSIFQPHTEWICKGKAGVAVELGIRVHIVEDRYRFILHHQVAQKKTDDKVAIPITTETKERYPRLNAVSFDKGYHSPENQRVLPTVVEEVTLPKKGRLNRHEREREQSDRFQAHRRRHSGVESAINALEQGGLDVCPDQGIDGFKRYVALAVVARNLKRMGAIIQKQQQDKEKRKRGPYKKAA
jgi:IS5 family transposase